MSGDDTEQLREASWKALNKLAKWRTIFAGWQLGTREKSDPEAQAVKDAREVLMVMRAELSAVINLLLEKNVITKAEWYEHLAKEANALDALYEKKFPGMRSTDEGVNIFNIPKAAETMKGWKP